ncbi:immune-related protein 2 [Elysia marginata]|uniref:Immune-related protein 2 n=1 Tax=Elysia marginata TaxID=1093978 RepID=A0AAV4J819_9GAST|nr:immune-related protein 2 [Elysia marginata]
MLASASFIFFLGLCNAFSVGGPEGACSSLMPSHGVGLQRGAPPYTITTSTAQVSAGQEITATISGTKPFKGFFIRMKQGDMYVDGQFTDNGGNKDRCSRTGVTHKDAQFKNSIKVVYRLGPQLRKEDGNPIFIAAVVEQKALIWRITSPEIAVASNTNVTSQPVPGTTPGTGPAPNQGGSDGDDDDDDNDKDSSVALQVGSSLLVSALVVGWALRR